MHPSGRQELKDPFGGVQLKKAQGTPNRANKWSLWCLVSFSAVQMDPITSGLTVLQVIQTVAQASALLYGYVASVCNADSSCQSLLNELSAVGGVLATVMVIEKDDSLPPNLRHALSKLMATDGPVANLLVELKSILPNEQARESGKMKTISRLTWPFKEKEAGAINDRLKTYCGEITQILAIDTWNTLREVKLELQQVSRTLQEGNRGVEEFRKDSAAQKVREQAYVAEERRKLLEWMNPVSCTEKHAASCGQRNPGTGRWIFQNGQFVAWNNSEGAFLWLNGQAGHGKTILASAVFDEIQDYPDLVGRLVNLAEDARLRLFVTGRSEPDIQDAFRDLPTLSMKDSAEQMKADICAHITEQLKNQKRLSRLSDALKKTILEKLLEGMFRWVQCQLDVIMTCKRPDSIRKALDDLPAGLYETYDRIIHSIEERGKLDGPIAQRCSLFLAGAFTPLTLDQLNEAMTIEVGRPSLNEDLGVMDIMDIVAACGSLVTYNERTRIVALSHYSVKV
ncbi:hypothetical protein F4604DRAFT_1683657 [Suillus subluteus]|nr:hypothetical protein F4604DRAFT_1683657 [Suillus subluteus]